MFKLLEFLYLVLTLKPHMPFIIIWRDDYDVGEPVNRKKIIKKLEEIDGIRGYDIADTSYHTLSIESWRRALSDIYSFKSEAPYIPNILDCDNHSLIMQALVSWTSFASYRAGQLERQLAFGIARSKDHSYNIFLDNNLDFWVFEPQNGRIIGKMKDLNESGEKEDYVTRYVWMIV